MRPPSQADIAGKLGLSRSTVGHVLSGRGQDLRISEDTIRKVKKEAERLNYVPNRLATGLRQNRTGAVGVVVSGIDEFGWAGRLLRGIRCELKSAQITTLIAARDWDAAEERDEVQRFLEYRVDGIIIDTPVRENLEFYAHLLDSGTKLVFACDTLPELPQASFVAWDAYQAAKMVVTNLIRAGRKRVAFCGLEHHTLMTARRYEGYRDALSEAGLKVPENWVRWWSVDNHDAVEKAKALVSWTRDTFCGDNAANACFALNDMAALNMIRVLEWEGTHVPDDVVVAGMGDLTHGKPEESRIVTCREPLEEMGEAAGRLMKTLIDGESRSDTSELIECNEWITRDATRQFARE